MGKRANIVIHKNIENSKFDTIVYREKISKKFLVELPEVGKIFEIPSDDIGQYIRGVKTITNWMYSWDNEYFKINGNEVFHFKNITSDFHKFNINIKTSNIRNKLNFSRENIKKLSKFNNTEDFNINFRREGTARVGDDKIMERLAIEINATLPFPPLVGVTKTNTEQNTFTIKNLFCNLNDEYYHFPYGNVWRNGDLCRGHIEPGNSKKFLYQFLVSQFNDDLDFDIKYNNNAQITFNNDIIEKELEKEFNNRSLSLVDILYYFSNLSIPEFQQLNFNKIFLKPLKNPMRYVDESN